MGYNEIVNRNEHITTSTPRSEGFKMPPEWHQRAGTLMSWPVRAEAWLAGLEEAREGYSEVAAAIGEFEALTMVVRPELAAELRRRLGSAAEVWELPHDDSWLRDNGPTVVLDPSGAAAGVSWRFNAWGRKYEPYDADDALAARILDRLGLRRFDAPLVLEGGSIHVDGEGTVLTTEECLLAPDRNPDLSKEDIEGYLRDYLGAEVVLWLDRGLWGDETDGHVDNLACFVRPGLVVMQTAADSDSPNYRNSRNNLDRLALMRDAAGRRLEVAALPEPPSRSWGGESLTLSYINFYPVEGGLIVPLFGSDGSSDMRRADDRALGILTDLYPGRKIVGIDGMKIIKGGGNVHCITQQLPASVGHGGSR